MRDIELTTHICSYVTCKTSLCILLYTKYKVHNIHEQNDIIHNTLQTAVCHIVLPLSTPVAAAALGGLSFTTIALLERDLPVCLTPSQLTAIDLEGTGLEGKCKRGRGMWQSYERGQGL